jgi:hypothetical protein
VSDNDDSLKPSPQSQIADIKKHGFMRGKLSGNRCDYCGRPVGVGWWGKVSGEYNERSCYCRKCAYARACQHDNVTDAVRKFR